MLADVDAGSDTPSLVGKVLKWRKEDGEGGTCIMLSCLFEDPQATISCSANALWTSLDRTNQALAQVLLHLSKLYADDRENYTDAVKYISSLSHLQVSSTMPSLTG